MFEVHIWFTLLYVPPLLAQRPPLNVLRCVLHYCWAGLLGIKLELSLQRFPLGNRLVSAQPIPTGGEWYNSSTEFNRRIKLISSDIYHIKPTLTLQTPKCAHTTSKQIKNLNLNIKYLLYSTCLAWEKSKASLQTCGYFSDLYFFFS